MSEIWKPVAGFEAYYSVSSNGAILSHRNGRLRKPVRCKGNGYLMMVLDGDGGYRKTKAIHRIVAEAFLERSSEQTCVNHKNEIKTDNRLENLEWCTYSENELHSYRKLGKKLSPENHQKMIEAHTKSVSTPVMQFALDGTLVNTFSSMAEAHRRTGISQGNISECCNNRRNKAGGFKWCFVICMQER